MLFYFILRKLHNVSHKIRYIELKFNEISLLFDLQTVISLIKQ